MAVVLVFAVLAGILTILLGIVGLAIALGKAQRLDPRAYGPLLYH